MNGDKGEIKLPCVDHFCIVADIGNGLQQAFLLSMDAHCGRHEGVPPRFPFEEAFAVQM